MRALIWGPSKYRFLCMQLYLNYFQIARYCKFYAICGSSVSESFSHSFCLSKLRSLEITLPECRPLVVSHAKWGFDFL